MLPSREASAPSKMRTGCWRMSGAAIATTPEITLDQISEQLSLGVDRVMAEGSLYDRELAALAIKQARGDLIEAIFLVRAFRGTLPRFGATEPVDTGAMQLRRRISSTFKDIPGGQILGATFDYTHRLLDPQLAEGFIPEQPATSEASTAATSRVTDILGRDGLIESSPQADANAPVGDLTREPLSFPADRDLRLQNLARADEGFLLALGYSSQRGYGRNHPFAGEIRLGEVEVEFVAEDAGFAVPLGAITLTECQMVNQFKGSVTEAAVLHPRLWARLRPQRAQDHVNGAGGPRFARARTRRRGAGAGAGRGVS